MPTWLLQDSMPRDLVNTTRYHALALSEHQNPNVQTQIARYDTQEDFLVEHVSR